MNEKIITSNIHKCIQIIKKTEDNKTVSLRDVRSVKPFGVDDDDQISFFLSLVELKSDEKKYVLIMPNLIALYLNNTKRNITAGIRLLKEVLKKYQDNVNELEDDDIKKIYDYFEYIETAIVSIYMAVESFANTCIPEDYKYHKLKSNGVEEIYDKSTIEKNIPTSEKLTEILPAILKIESPSQKYFWSSFKEIEKLRNRIVHCKENASSDLLQDLLNNKNINRLVKDTLDLLQFYVSNDNQNLIFPMGFGNSSIPIFNIADSLELVN